MKLIVPDTISLTSSTVAASTESEWSSGSTYNTDNVVKVTSDKPHREYKSLTDANTGNDPTTDTTNWVGLGATNRWAMFDEYVSSQTEDTDEIKTVFPTLNIGNVSLFQLDASSVQIELYDNTTSTMVFDETYSMVIDNIMNWYDYFFSPVDLASDFTVDLPPYYDAVLTVTITKSGTVKCGHLVYGKVRELGKTKYGLSVGILDYSRKLTNPDFGTTYLSQGVWAKKITVDVRLSDSAIDIVQGALVSVRGMPAVFNFNNSSTSLTSLLVYGFFREFQIIVPGKNLSFCSFNIEGLT